jgi:FixJ family two-component response regulator
MSAALATIAVLDDEVQLRIALVRLLKAHGYAAADFAGGADLLAALDQRHFDCILLDLFMPGMPGLDVLAALGKIGNAPPAIVITAHDDPDLMRQALALHASEVQHKPISAPGLIEAIERARRASRPPDFGAASGSH